MVVDRKLEARLLRRIDELPVLPTVVAELMSLDRTADDFFDRVCQLVESDPTFAARILAAANSAASAPRSPIAAVPTALARLGAASATDLVLAAAVSRVFVPKDDWERSLWRHALQVAAASRLAMIRIGPSLDVRPEEAYAAGLLHDVGRFVLFAEAPDTLRQIDEGGWDDPQRLLELEVSICGLTHGQIGQMACERWGLPAVLGEVILRHHEADVDPAASRANALISGLHFIDLAMFPSAMPGAPGYDQATMATIEAELMPKRPSGFTLTADALHKLIADVTEETDQVCRSLGLV